MRKIFGRTWLALTVLTGALAQPPATGVKEADLWRQQAEQEYLRNSLMEAGPRTAVEIAKRRDAEYRANQFREKVNRFILKWNQLFDSYYERNTFNFRTARDLSKAFHELERSEGWPSDQRK